jgi:hypothetical protein
MKSTKLCYLFTKMQYPLEDINWNQKIDQRREIFD